MQKYDKEIKKLPLKLREKLRKDYVETMINARDMMGWDEVHEDIKKALIRDSQDQIVADYSCRECGMGVYKGYYPLCYLCKVAEVEIASQHIEEDCRGCFWCTQPQEEEEID